MSKQTQLTPLGAPLKRRLINTSKALFTLLMLVPSISWGTTSDWAFTLLTDPTTLADRSSVTSVTHNLPGDTLHLTFYADEFQSLTSARNGGSIRNTRQTISTLLELPQDRLNLDQVYLVYVHVGAVPVLATRIVPETEHAFRIPNTQSLFTAMLNPQNTIVTVRSWDTIHSWRIDATHFSEALPSWWVTQILKSRARGVGAHKEGPESSFDPLSSDNTYQPNVKARLAELDRELSRLSSKRATTIKPTGN